MEQIKIAIDAMGGDNAPSEIIKGAAEALEGNLPIKLLLVGQSDKIKAELKKYKVDKSKIEIIQASEIIGNDEIPTAAIKKKKDSSIVVGLNLVKQQTAQAFISAGCTGALLTGATVIVGRLKGVERPALGTLLPNKKGFALLIDAGANVDSKPTYLVQFAQMGSIYVENMLNIKSPKVGLVNVGEEREKGNTLVKEAYPLLEQANLNFIGNVEAREIPMGKADVIVSDGFVGNVILKYSEGFAKALLSIMKAEIMQGMTSKLGALLIKPALKRMMKKLDYTEYGGAPLLGLKGIVIKTHGSADSNAVKSTIKQCYNLIQAKVIDKTAQKIIN